MKTFVFDGDPCFGSNPSTVDYCIPCPSIETFGYTADMGILRTQVARGRHRQRRLYLDQPRTYQLSWNLSTEALNKWERFAQDYGYSWHRIPAITGQVPGWFPVEHPVRFTSNYEVNLIREDLWEVTVQAEQWELDPDCLLELLCDEMMSCLDTYFPHFVLPDYKGVVDVIGYESVWGNPNG